jgi:hypothetical protein
MSKMGPTDVKKKAINPKKNLLREKVPWAYESFNPTLLTRIFKSDKINNVVGNQFYSNEAAVKN